MPCFDARLRLASQDVDEEIQLVPHFNVARLDVWPVHLCLNVSFDGTSIAFHRRYRLKECAFISLTKWLLAEHCVFLLTL